MLKFFMRWARRCQAGYPVPVTGLVVLGRPRQKLNILSDIIKARKVHAKDQFMIYHRFSHDTSSYALTGKILMSC